MHIDNSIRELIENFKIDMDFKGSLLYDEPMSLHTTFKIGGAVSAFASPDDLSGLYNIANFLYKNSIPFFVLGGGSNIVPNDSGIEGVVISTEKLDNIKIISDKNNSENVLLECEAGTSMKKLVDFCVQNGLTGMERFSGLPGTAGGAVFMNARCFDCSIDSVFESAAYINLKDFTEQNLHFNEDDWDYKKSPFQKISSIITKTVFRLKSDKDIKKIAKDADYYVRQREAKGHFKYPSAGSVFKNNRKFGFPSGKIIDELGLRGYGVGEAMIAPWHGNFIINTGSATQKDVKKLVEFIIERVKNERGFELEPEIIFLDAFQ